MKILVIDDEVQIRKVLELTLAAEGHIVRLAKNAVEGLQQALLPDAPDAVLLDLGLPDRDGLDLLTDIRKSSQLPVIMLSVKGDESIKVRALDLGADDYLTKPFSAAELLARLRAVTRRRGLDDPAPARIYTKDRLKIDFEKHQVFVSGEERHLTKTEFAILQFFVSNPGRVLTHRQILERVWGEQAGVQLHYLRVYVNNLRKKIEVSASRPYFISTEPGIGYRFVGD
jgi:two-component system KDP operon response regulator KdpE